MRAHKFHHLSLLLIALALLAVACSPTRNRWLNRNWHTMTGHYNVYFNGETKFIDAMETLQRSHQDDFGKILSVFPYGDESTQKGISGVMDEVIKKMSLTIQNHTVGTYTDDAYLLLGKAQYFKRDYYAALEPFQYINAKYKDGGLRPISTSWIAKCYMGLKKEGEAEAIMGLLLAEVDPIQLKGKLSSTNGKKLKISHADKADIYATAADISIKQENYTKAIEKLLVAVDNESRKPIRIRYHFILGQLYEQQGKTKEANKHFTKVLHMLAPYDFEFNASIHLARSYDSTDKSAVRSVRRSLKRMLRDDKNDGMYDQIYYELGNLEYKEKNRPEAIKAYKQAAAKSTKNANQKALAYLALANIYLEQPEYKLAQAYYDSAATSLRPDYKDYEKIMAKKSVLSELISNLVVIETEDSLQKLAMMSKADLEKKIDSWILNAKVQAEQKAKEEKRRKDIEKSNEANQSMPVSAANQIPGFGGGEAQWYFYNPTIMASGAQEFFSQRKWGQRPNTDYWRIAAKEKETPLAGGNTDQNGGGKTGTDSSAVKDSTSTTVSKNNEGSKAVSEDKQAWIANVPFGDAAMQKSKDKELEAYYNIGIIYDEKLNDQKEAIADFETMLSKFPGNEHEPEVLYRLYKLNTALKRKAKADDARAQLISKYPESPYALIVQNKGAKTADSDANREVVQLYENMYQAYQEGRYEEVKAKKMEAAKKYPGNSIQAKFELLNAMAIGKTEPQAQFKLALISITKEYAKTDVADRAQAILDYMKKQERAALPDSVRKELEPDFVVETAGAQYYILAIKNDKVDFTEFVGKISQFNDEFHQFDNLRSNTMLSNEGYQLLVVREFSDYPKAIAYIKDIEMTDFIRKQLKVEVPYLQFVISVNNFKKMLKEQKLESYEKIFRKQYAAAPVPPADGKPLPPKQ